MMQIYYKNNEVMIYAKLYRISTVHFQRTDVHVVNGAWPHKEKRNKINGVWPHKENKSSRMQERFWNMEALEEYKR